jgi:inner membrane protein
MLEADWLRGPIWCNLTGNNSAAKEPGMAWWIWVLIGFLLLALELVTPSLHIGFFGVGAIVVGLLVGVGLDIPIWLELLLFVALSLLLLFILRKPLRKRFETASGAGAVDSIQNEPAVTLEKIAVNAIGRAELRGAPWRARNIDQRDLEAGERCRVQQMDGLTLLIRAE